MSNASRIPLCVLACVVVGSAPLSAQDRLPPDSSAIRLAHCVAGSLPVVQQAVDSARPPLLVVGERRLGPVRRFPACPDSRALDGSVEIRFIRPFAARELYREEGRFGVVILDGWPTLRVKP
ncbi:hypothetical protein Strain138_001666 [Pseudogemmatithrix spongiicola]|uniref:Uncharacterized protein n=1 Tax=Pseudogemmatithrix spongiicola TaxID=3062599 RepID=A0AA49K133_9BACT|nr:hypothetical protein Strain138_001666 [Gemmatimonadaceae bacterium 'strain 138']WKW15288.1 hypothetical protein Strain318_001665 [Gemmatimonadaceae bacterium 'strain 318']